MKKIVKRIVSIALALLLLGGAAPMAGVAEWLGGVTASAASYSGTCGDNLTWTLDTDTGILTVSGTGAMTNYSWSSAPWYSYRNEIQSVVIKPGVTSIGDYAFYECKSLTSITLPESVTSIGRNAFYGVKIVNYSGTCGDDLTWMLNTDTGVLTISGTGTMPDYSWDQMPWRSYRNEIQSVAIESGVTSISHSAFKDCTSLTNVTLPEGVTSIGWDAFDNCANLTSITLPEGLTSIGDSVFGYCESLASITIPDSVTSIGTGAFYGCTRLESITLPEGLTSIGNYAFDGCTSLESITLPDGLTSIGSYAFYGCTSLESITLPEGLTSIGSYAFSRCASLASIMIPASVTSIGERAFYYCTSLVSVTLSEGTSVTPSENVGYIGTCAFVGCTRLTSIMIPNGVTRIMNEAFSGCSRLRSITLPASVTNIYVSAFFCCPLKDVYYYGTQAQWDAIEIDSYNAPLCDATLHFMCCADGHSYAVTQTQAPTCTEDGQTVYTCTECGETDTQILPATGHTVVVDAAVAPTTTETGLTEGSHCSVCGKVLVAQQVVPALGNSSALELSSGRAYIGQDVEVTVRIRNNPGIIATRFSLDYDPTVLSLKNVENGEIFPDSAMLAGKNLDAVPFCVLFEDSLSHSDYSEDGVLVCLTFTVLPDAPVGVTPITISYDNRSTFNTTLSYVSLDMINGGLDIWKRLPGDADGDGEVTLRDAMLINRFLVGGYGDIAINTDCADVNADGEVTLMDVALIKRYLAGGWGVELQ